MHPNAPNGLINTRSLTPASVPAERAVIGSVLLSPEVFPRVSSIVNTLDFSTLAHREIWRSICAVALRAQAPDTIAVHAELRARKIAEGGTDDIALGEICDTVVTVALVEQHARAVREAGQRRRLVEIARTVVDSALRPDEDIEELSDRVRMALDDVGKGAAPPKQEALPIMSLSEIPDPGPTRWLVEGLWTDRAFGILGALPKSWKSFFTLQLAISVATGLPLFGRHDVHRIGRVLIFQAEGGSASIRRRMGALCRALGMDLEQLDVHVIDTPMMHLDRPDTMARFMATVEAVKPVLTILDPLRELHTGDENDSSYVAQLLAPLRTLQARVGCAVLVVHHFSKPPGDGKSLRRPMEQLRGNGAMGGAVDSFISLASKGEGEEKRALVEIQHRDAREPEPFTIKLQLIAHPDGEALKLELTEGDGRDEVAKALDQRDAAMRKVLRTIVQSSIPGRERIASIRALAKATGMAQRTARDALQSLIETKLVEHADDGFSATAAGKERECEQRK